MRINYPKNNNSLDFSSVIGLFLTFSLLYLAISIGSSPRSYFDLPAFLIVCCGTITLTFSCSNFEQFRKLPKILYKMIILKNLDPKKNAIFVIEVANFMREQQNSKIEEKLNFSKCDYLFKKFLSLVSDNIEIEKMSSIIDQEINTYIDDIAKSITIVRKAGEVSPPMGLIGTLIGMIQMLRELNNTDKLGPAMSICLLTSFYGTVLSYIVFFPLAAKIEKNFADRLINAKIYKEAALSIAKRENPRLLEIYINSLLSAENNVNYFEK